MYPDCLWWHIAQRQSILTKDIEGASKYLLEREHGRDDGSVGDFTATSLMVPLILIDGIILHAQMQS